MKSEKLVSMKPIIKNTVRRVLKSGDIALLLLDWEIRVASDDHSSVQHGTATQIVERSAAGKLAAPGLEPARYRITASCEGSLIVRAHIERILNERPLAGRRSFKPSAFAKLQHGSAVWEPSTQTTVRSVCFRPYSRGMTQPIGEYQ